VRIQYAKALSKDLEAVCRNTGIKKRLPKIIEMLKKIDSLSELQDIKKIEGYDNYYRLRVGDYRLGQPFQGGFLTPSIMNDIHKINLDIFTS
jgi:mRNA interferase RelE/StbE